MSGTRPPWRRLDVDDLRRVRTHGGIAQRVTPVNQLLLLDSVEGIQTRPNSCQRFDDLIRAGHGGRQLVIGDPRIDSLF
jgi:hypothetical protein